MRYIIKNNNKLSINKIKKLTTVISRVFCVIALLLWGRGIEFHTTTRKMIAGPNLQV